MPLSRILTVVLCLPIFIRAMIQNRDTIESTVQCQPDFVWTYNNEGLSPCFIMSAVFAPCFQGQYTTTPLQPGTHYDPPINTTVTRCSCSWAAYNLLSACTACQGQTSSIAPWPTYHAECGDAISNTTYWPSDILIASNHTIPFYAGHNPNLWRDQQFNVPQAKSIADQNEPDLTGADQNLADPNLPAPSSQKKAKPIGAIVGGTIGGVVFLVLVLYLLCYIRRRKRAASGPREVQARRPSFFSYISSDDWESRKRALSMISYSSFGSVSPSLPTPNTNSSTMYTYGDGAMQSFSQFGAPSMYTTLPQTSPSHQHHGGMTSPAPTMQTFAPGPDMIEPFTLMSPGEAPESLAHRRKASEASSGISFTQSVDHPGQTTANQQTPLSTPQASPGLNSDNTHRLEGVVEEEGNAGVAGRGRSESQPPAYSLHASDTSSSHDLAIARREAHGHGHRAVGSPEKGSQDSQTSWASSGGISDSTVDPTTASQGQAREEAVQTPRPDGVHRYHSVMSTDSRDDPGANVA